MDFGSFLDAPVAILRGPRGERGRRVERGLRLLRVFSETGNLALHGIAGVDQPISLGFKRAANDEKWQLLELRDVQNPDELTRANLSFLESAEAFEN
ncbi:MAG: hypothetical protein OEU92_13995, partial [Alphaproteobacteria bacterium]|nr:hypothetical protein [Alphaproteobacteria bacterium]